MDIQKSISLEKFELSFNNKTVSFLVDRKHNIWFKGKGIAQILEYVKPRNAISIFVSDEYKTTFKELVCNIEPEMITEKTNHPHTLYIDECGLNQLIMKSNLSPENHFKKWIYEEVLPLFRKFAQYEKINANLRRELDEVRETSKRESEELRESYEKKFEEFRESYQREFDKVGKSSKREIGELREISIKEENQLRQYIDYIKTYTVHMNINKSKLHSFIVLKIHFNDRDGYYAIRIQTMNVKKTIEKIQKRYPGTIMILRYYFIPNAINFYNLMKEQLKDKLDFRGNLFSIKCNRISQSNLLSAIDRLFHEKKL